MDRRAGEGRRLIPGEGGRIGWTRDGRKADERPEGELGFVLGEASSLSSYDPEAYSKRNLRSMTLMMSSFWRV